jgi:excisionase family DNA binding protein
MQGNSYLYDLRGACEYLKISPPTMYRIIKSGEITYSKIGTGRGTYRFRQEDLDAYIEKNLVEPRVTPPRE